MQLAILVQHPEKKGAGLEIFSHASILSLEDYIYNISLSIHCPTIQFNNHTARHQHFSLGIKPYKLYGP